MSQLVISRLFKPSGFNRILKSSVCKDVIRHNKKVRMFSSKPIYSYMLIDHLLNATHCSNDQAYYDAKYKKELVIKDKGLADEVREAMTVGFSRKDEWEASLEKSEDNSTSLVLVNNTMKHHLPPLPSTSLIHNVAISNSPDIEKEDLVVAVKFLGSQVSLCKPFSNSDSGWTNINASGSVHPFSSLLYSKKNKKFLTVSASGNYLWSVDLHFKEEEDEDEDEEEEKCVRPEFAVLLDMNDSLEKLWRFRLESLIWCSRTDHLVESPSGEHFLVKWFREDLMGKKHKEVKIMTQQTEAFLVFRVDTVCSDLIYTQDIGDLCIFLGHSEAFCVPASSSPGLRPNSIYYVGSTFGVHDIANFRTTTFFTEDKVMLRSTEFPYWPTPFSCC
ncbi:unnamed protein product [Thlaspi arvense]|uniref:KIB1-4 beta-propeller domain-containing protein n=1 Tax=Thlaspi arvense TaxID=13288 RepID=A0AAU9T5Q3_THLAR|nr:unnamed protein product [Thlaspi arvense]